MIPDKATSNPVPSTGWERWSSLVPSNASSLKMIALCDFIKTLSQPFELAFAGKVAKNVSLSLTGVSIIKQATNGELKTILNPENVVHEDPTMRVRFWRTLSLSCMLASESSRLFFGEPKDQTDQNQLLAAMQMIGKIGVLSMDVSRMESVRSSLDDLFNYSHMPPAEKLAKITETAIFSLSVLKVIVPSDQTTLNLMIGILSSSLGVIKAFSANVATSKPENPFDILKTKIVKKLDLKIPAPESEIRVKGRQTLASLQVYERSNFQQNLKDLKASQNEIDLYRQLNELVDDVLQFKEPSSRGLISSNEDSISASDIEMFLELQKNSAKGVFSKIERKNLELLAFKLRLEVLYESLLLLQENEKVKSREIKLQTVIDFLKVDIERINVLTAQVKDRAPLESSCTLSISGYDSKQLNKGLKLIGENDFELDLQKWLLEVEELTDPRYEKSIDATIASIASFESNV